MATATSGRPATKVVSKAEWVAARKELLREEKEFTRLRDELSRKRRELPWEQVEKQYVFDGPNGRETLAELFDGRSQLIVYHFMLGPGWKEGCPSCSFIADSFEGAVVHLAARDVTLAAVSHATLPEIEAFKKRMGWQFKWVSSSATEFNFDYQVSVSPEERDKKKVYYNYELTDFPSDERPGASIFYKNEAGRIFHTYSTYARGLDMLITAYNYLDLTPKGRDEEGLPHTMAWVRHHDRYSDSRPMRAVPSAADHACCSEENSKQTETGTPALASMLDEFREEAATTRRVLQRIPAGKLAWKPHPKSMSLGQLAMHIATVPGSLARITQQDSFDVSQGSFEPPVPEDLDEILAAFEQSVGQAEKHLKTMTDNEARQNWRLMLHDKQLLNKPRMGVMRTIMLNHWYHHRGQLSVYLRLLDVPVPVIYGRSADENPFP